MIFFVGSPCCSTRRGDFLPVVNKLVALPFKQNYRYSSWHPKNHGSFAERYGKEPGVVINLHGVNQQLWPTHCVQETFGADFVAGWDRSKIAYTVKKGADPL